MSAPTPALPRFASLCPLLQIFDMPTSLRFYRDVLGFRIVEQSSPGDDCDWVWLNSGGAHLMLNTRYEKDARPPVPDPARVEHHDDVGLYLEADDLDTIYGHLLTHGVDAEAPKVAPYGMRQLYLKDPDGYEICFQHPVT